MNWRDTHTQQFGAALALLVFSLVVSYYNYPAPPPLPKASALNSLEPVKTPDPHITPTFDPSLIISTTTYSAPQLAPSAPKKPVSVAKAPQKSPTKVEPSPKESFFVPKKTPVVIPEIVPTPTQPIATTPIPQQSASVPTPTPPDSLQPLRKALVNILCTSHKSPLRGSTGSGVIVDSSGIILTVAHVAQSELLSEALGPQVITCVVRTGNPARNTYNAKLIYISEPWVRNNSTTLISSQPMGTGENDFALLAITGSANGSSLPSSFPFVPLSQSKVAIGDTLGVGGYAAQYLNSTQIRTALSPTFVMGVLEGVYTFNKTTQDVLSILGGEAAQQGSSGGGVINTDGELVGLITTSEISGPAQTRHLRATTPGHLRESFMKDTEKNLDSYYANTSTNSLISSYAPKIQELGAFLANALGLQ